MSANNSTHAAQPERARYGQLSKAVKIGHLGSVRDLIKRGADVDEVDDSGIPVLVRAAKMGQLEIVRLLLDEGADPEQKVVLSGGESAFMWAAAHGHVEIARLLLDKGAKINEQSAKGTTALMAAIWHKCAEVIPLLLERGADLDLRDEKGRTALDIAVEIDHVESIQLLRGVAEAVTAQAEKHILRMTRLRELSRRQRVRIIPRA